VAPPPMNAAPAAMAPPGQEPSAPSSSEPEDPNKGGRPSGFRLNGLPVAAFRAGAGVFDSIRRGGLSTAGLAKNGAFVAWFEQADGGDRAFHAETMKYLVACALPAGRTAGYTDAQGTAHAFAGDLGLAPGWASAGAGSEAEQQQVTACLMAHANTALPQPRHIQIALRGAAPFAPPPAAVGSVLSMFDGVFFGDLFSSPARLYICSPSLAPPANYRASLLRDWGRDCFFAKDGCGGAFSVVDCAQACKAASGDVGYAWGPTCTAEGRTFAAVSAYVPRFAGAAAMEAVGAVRVPCERCLDFRALRLGPAASYARSDWRVAEGGAFVLDVHYAHPDSVAASLRIEVNGVAVMNGDSQTWDFSPTGGADVWRIRSIPLVLQPTNKIVLRGAGTTGPLVDAVWLRMP
jgi:hypothetical protein